MLREKLTAAANLLDGFIAANPKAAQTTDALLKLGHCHRRLGVQLPPGNERNEALNKSRAAFERLQGEFPQSSRVGTSHLERAKVIALQGDKGGAINALRQFANDPLQKSPVAPLAMIALATLLREQNQAQAAADALKQARDKYEAQLAADPERGGVGPAPALPPRRCALRGRQGCGCPGCLRSGGAGGRKQAGRGGERRSRASSVRWTRPGRR